ncbi:hypothetical protein ES702_01213 [subsurface metagenome]
MGISDNILFPIYKNFISKNVKEITGMVAFLGFSEKNDICRFVEDKYKVQGQLFDIQLGNWDLNEDEWSIKDKFDFILCLRTAYFARDSKELLAHFSNILNDEGILIIDWGLGSAHFPREISDWTFGWEYKGKRCYGEYQDKKYYLYSTFWDDLILNTEAGKVMINYAKRFHYYCDITNWGEKIRTEFNPSEIVTLDIIKEHFRIEDKLFFNTAQRGGRQALYSLFCLRKP